MGGWVERGGERVAWREEGFHCSCGECVTHAQQCVGTGGRVVNNTWWDWYADLVVYRPLVCRVC